ncbi:hypothetical protein Emag_000920 [Eimeria magna]
MGYLGVGQPLGWAESLPYQAAIKRRGIRQFLQLLRQFKDYEGAMKWGDEIEVFIIRVDEKRREMRLALIAGSSITEMNRREAAARQETHQRGFEPYEGALWQPEYASYMIEALPGAAAHLKPENWLRVEPSIRSRRAKLLSWLGPNTCPLFMTSFPLLGVDVQPEEGGAQGSLAAAGSFASPAAPADPVHSLSQSIFLGDEVINPHPRFGTLTANIRSTEALDMRLWCVLNNRRRGCKVEILVPLYMDESVDVDMSRKIPNERLFDSGLGGRQCILYHDEEANASPKKLSHLAALHKDENLLKQGDLYIYMDSMCFGMGMNCVQATFSCKTISDARYLYDQLIVMAPLLLSLTAATPFLRGCVAATDTRWDVISMSVDSRKAEEMKSVIKSRYSTNSLYISEKSQLAEDGQTEADLIKEGEMDWALDDGIVYETTEDFENLQSTNWNAVRFKPPPQFMTADQQAAGDASSLIGWRVELRTPEVQLTDFENANCIILIAALVELILEERIELYIPLSRNDVNMQRAAKLNSILNQRFYFRQDVRPNSRDLSFTEMSLHDILFGEAGPADDNVPEERRGLGLLNLCKRMFERKMEGGECSAAAMGRFMEMYNFFYIRTSGEVPTDAAFLRACLSAHPQYRNDSIVPPAAAYDICRLAMRIGNGDVEVPELLGPFANRHKNNFLSKERLCVVAKQANCSKGTNPATLLHGRGFVAASLRHPEIHERLQALMLPAVQETEICAKAESMCNGFASDLRLLVPQEIKALHDSNLYRSD